MAHLSLKRIPDIARIVLKNPSLSDTDALPALLNVAEQIKADELSGFRPNELVKAAMAVARNRGVLSGLAKAIGIKESSVGGYRPTPKHFPAISAFLKTTLQIESPEALMAEYQRTRPPPLDYNPKHFLPALRWTIGSDRGAKAAFAREAAPIIGLQDVSLQAALGREIATEHHTALAGIFGKSPKQLINDYLATHPELNRIASPSRDEDLQR